MEQWSNYRSCSENPAWKRNTMLYLGIYPEKRCHLLLATKIEPRLTVPMSVSHDWGTKNTSYPIPLCSLVQTRIFITHSAKGPWNQSLNSIFPTKYVIPKSLKVSHWLSKIISYHNPYYYNQGVGLPQPVWSKQPLWPLGFLIWDPAKSNVAEIAVEWYGARPTFWKQPLQLFLDLCKMFGKVPQIYS